MNWLSLFLLTSPIQALYNSLDQTSIAEQMAFYDLYPETEEGKLALSRTWALLRSTSPLGKSPPSLLPPIDIQGIVNLVTRQPQDPPIKLGEVELEAIASLSAHFGNRKLQGSTIWTKKELLELPEGEVDLCRGLLIEQFEDSPTFQESILQYEASLDLMALQISARLSQDSTPLNKIREINKYIFQEMHFRFPPHSLYAKDIDLYTFLPSVLDSRQGVCLGVSILYLCLAQRLNLPLEIITPPGHIYVRYLHGDETINIETTARGINPPNESYLGINTRSLQKRELREVIGMAFVNQAAAYWQRQEYERCIGLYEKALPYLQKDRLVQMFLGLNYLFVGRKKEGEQLLKPLRQFTFDYAVAPESVPADYLDKKIDIKGLQTIFLPVDSSRESIIAKQKELKQILKKYPRFRAGHLQLAVTYLQLARSSEALEALHRYHTIDPTDPTVEYYLSIVASERHDFKRAWTHLEQAEMLTSKKDHYPAALKALRNKLKMASLPNLQQNNCIR